eukprot:SAG11_NODE_573_length_8438_cov_22.469601_2_plen_87_part_00
MPDEAGDCVSKLTGLVRRVARSDQTFRDDEERGGVEPLARIDLGINDRCHRVRDQYGDKVYRDSSSVLFFIFHFSFFKNNNNRNNK